MLSPGTRFGGYEVTTEIGRGGMGVVYRARDTRLKRDVALKTLPQEVASSPDRMARFQREAELLASLNHVNIAHVYGIEEQGDGRALVMELVDGPTLADRLSAGAIPVDEAIGIADQIVDALEAAHAQGVVHRDMKPSNIKLRSDGVVKVLDFGLAKALDPVAGSSSRSLVPTMTTPAATEAGSILGTAPYMSPEQAIGKSVDARTDIWAFGCIVYEMLVGVSPFARETSSQTVAAILEHQPDWARLPKQTPAALRRLLERCLTKDAKRRLRDIGDARADLAEKDSPAETSPARTRSSTMPWVAGLIGAIVVGALVWVFKSAPGASSPRMVARLVIVPPPGEAIDAANFGVAISPDGRRVAYVLATPTHKQIYLRDVDQFDSMPLPGTDGGDAPFFSPDGQWIGFVGGGRLRKTRPDGGLPQTITETTQTLSSFGVASWEADGNIYFTPTAGTGIWRVPATGGRPTAVTTLTQSEHSHRWPQLLPDGKTLLFTAAAASESQVFVQSLETGERHALLKGTGARYLPSGHLVFTQGGILSGIRFDLAHLQVVGSAVPVLSGFMEVSRLRNSSLTTLVPQISISTSGTVAYVPAPAKPPRDALVWVSRTGVETPSGASGGRYFQPRISPDGNRVAVTVGGDDNDDVWLYDLNRETWSHLTSGGNNGFPLWSPDGTQLVHVSDRAGPDNMYLMTLDQTKDERIVASDRPNYPLAWSRDQTLMYVVVNPLTLLDIFMLHGGLKSPPEPVIKTPFGEGAPAISPDGHSLAYVSNESGRNEVYVVPFGRTGERSTISTEGGNEPVWSPTGRELFFRKGNDLMAVDVSPGPPFGAGKPRRLFTGPYEQTLSLWPDYDISRDGQRFLMVKRIESGDRSTQINVVLNWSEELERLLPAN